ncbi:helix-turn-helix transcriptional regulator [Porphyromonadaceae bacterium W3.11]|nr:helix-turn-helix transcriptional regulator [Porphyromonadaceae bacterium W3.11]
MALVKSYTVLSDLVQEQIAILPMLNRFGIRLGLGDATIAEICDERQLDTGFFLHIINSYLDPDYLGRVKLAPKHTVLIADYLEVANRYYLDSQLPNIEVHIASFVKKSGANVPLLQTLPHVLEELKETLTNRVRLDEEELLPQFRTLAGELAENISTITLEGQEKAGTEADRAEALVADIMQVMIRHLKGDFNDNLLHAVLYSLSLLKSDLASNNRLRERVFIPMLESMQKARKIE